VHDDERKHRFLGLLEELLADCDGVKMRLAEKLGLKPSTLTPWFQGKIDPATIDLAIFLSIANASNCSIDELVKRLGIIQKSEISILNKFKILIRDLLSTQTQEMLAKKVGVTSGAVASWVRKERAVDPRRVSIGTIAGLAREKNWSIDRLLIYLDLKEINDRDNLSIKLKTDATILSLSEQIDLLAWLSNLVTGKLKEPENLSQIIQNSNQRQGKNRTVCIILEKEDLAIASNYASNLAIHLNLKPENIKVTTISKLPESIANIDILIFDISTPESASIALIENIEFDRDIIVLTNADLPVKVRSSLEDKVTDVVVKPIDWQEFKDKSYFT